jgi:transposase InsO family protein
MPYTSNKKMPAIRRNAARLYFKGWSARKIGRYFGFHHTAVMKWVREARKLGDVPIPTRSSNPSHPNELPKETVKKIVETRRSHNRYAEAVFQELRNKGVHVSLSSVKRTLDRNYLTKKKSPWKRFHPHQDRPYPLKSGDLVEIDTIHLMVDEKKRIYIFVLIDVYSRWAYARCYEKMSGKIALKFVREAQKNAPFLFGMFQSDHGPEFGDWFVTQVKKSHRYTRIGKPNDNAHIERFNRTLQEECVDRLPRKVRIINCALKKYLQYYNHERLHTGLNFLTPMQVV